MYICMYTSSLLAQRRGAGEGSREKVYQQNFRGKKGSPQVLNFIDDEMEAQKG